jgi:hypothetical protein
LWVSFPLGIAVSDYLFFVFRFIINRAGFPLPVWRRNPSAVGRFSPSYIPSAPNMIRVFDFGGTHPEEAKALGFRQSLFPFIGGNCRNGRYQQKMARSKRSGY